MKCFSIILILMLFIVSMFSNCVTYKEKSENVNDLKTILDTSNISHIVIPRYRFWTYPYEPTDTTIFPYATAEATLDGIIINISNIPENIEYIEIQIFNRTNYNRGASTIIVGNELLEIKNIGYLNILFPFTISNNRYGITITWSTRSKENWEHDEEFYWIGVSLDDITAIGGNLQNENPLLLINNDKNIITLFPETIFNTIENFYNIPSFFFGMNVLLENYNGELMEWIQKDEVIDNLTNDLSEYNYDFTKTKYKIKNDLLIIKNITIEGYYEVYFTLHCIVNYNNIIWTACIAESEKFMARF